MQGHLSGVHEVGSYVCHKCGVVYKFMEELEKHLQGGHRELSQVLREAGFECPSCDYVEGSEETIRKHMVSNQQRKEWPMQRVVRARGASGGGRVVEGGGTGEEGETQEGEQGGQENGGSTDCDPDVGPEGGQRGKLSWPRWWPR